MEASPQLVTVARLKARPDEPADRWFQPPQLSTLGGQSPSLLVIWRGRVHRLPLDELLAQSGSAESFAELSTTIVELEEGRGVALAWCPLGTSRDLRGR